jgi:hypothetical protein
MAIAGAMEIQFSQGLVQTSNELAKEADLLCGDAI